ncbi:TPA: hypothetical protein VEO38_000003 [Providencia alcalifaciens]|nr:hypothetical protein [Providencia alcalifaciens]
MNNDNNKNLVSIKGGVYFILNSSGETINSVIVSYYSGWKQERFIQKIENLYNLEMAESGCLFTYQTTEANNKDHWDVDFRTTTGKAVSYRKQKCHIQDNDNGVVILNVTKDFKLYIRFSNSGGCYI